VLWLSDNPCAEAPGYRAAAIRSLPALTKLDNTEVTPEERAAAEADAAAKRLLPAGSHELGDEQQQPSMGAAPGTGERGGDDGHCQEGAHRANGQSLALQPGSSASALLTGSTAASRPAVASQRDCTEPGAGGCGCLEGAQACGDGWGDSQGNSSGGSGSAGHRNILYAVMALLPELGARELALVAREAERLSLGAD
jgi:hypothetical protein